MEDELAEHASGARPEGSGWPAGAAGGRPERRWPPSSTRTTTTARTASKESNQGLAEADVELRTEVRYELQDRELGLQAMQLEQGEAEV